jgi:hypothetical protein
MTSFLASTLLPRLVASNTVLFVCDIQERFRPIIHNYQTVIDKTAFMYKISALLDIPCIITEQAPKALGHTCEEISSIARPTTKVFEKKQFSMLTPEVSAHFDSLKRKQVIMCGIEAHVCVQQTTLDLLQSGFDVHIICDAVSSSRQYDRAIAMKRMTDSGAVASSAESSIFDLMRSAEHPNFKEISALIKDHNKNCKNLFSGGDEI